MAAGMVGMCLFKRLYTAAVPAVFNLSMDKLGTLVCALLCYSCITPCADCFLRGGKYIKKVRDNFPLVLKNG